MMPESRFPVLDYDRTSDDFNGNCYAIVTESRIEPSVAETDEWVALPIRSIIDGNSGPGFEIGPFSLTEGDVVALHNALVDHCARYPEMFRRVGSGEA